MCDDFGTRQRVRTAYRRGPRPEEDPVHGLTVMEGDLGPGGSYQPDNLLSRVAGVTSLVHRKMLSHVIISASMAREYQLGPDVCGGHR